MFLYHGVGFAMHHVISFEDDGEVVEIALASNRSARLTGEDREHFLAIVKRQDAWAVELEYQRHDERVRRQFVMDVTAHMG